MNDDYLTVLDNFETETEIKKSRFIARVYHVENEKAAEKILAAVRKEHYKATHVCWAYGLNTVPERKKASDDGEPSGTAGRPILEVISRRQLKDVLVIVIRYFGGIKLGAGGLVRAYSGGAAQVLNHCQVVKKQYSDILTVEIDYTHYGGLMNVLTSVGYKPVSEDFGEKVSLDFEIEVFKTPSFLETIRETTNDRFEYILIDRCFVDVLQ